MGTETTIRKEVKFVYCQAYLKIDSEILKENQRKCKALDKIKEKLSQKKKLSKSQELILADKEVIRQKNHIYEKYGRSIWDAAGMFRYLDEEKIDSNIDIDEMIVEIEPGTLQIGEEYISFQLTKMRDNMLPAKKKKGSTKEDITLDNDEYIGEFTSILYDIDNSVFMIQSNMHGVSVGQIESYLTLLRRRIIEKMKLNDMSELACELSVIVNSFDLENIRQSQMVRKIRFRAADGTYTFFQDDEKNFLGNIRRSFGEKTGYVIDVTVSIDRETEVKSLDKKLISDVLDNFDYIEESQHDSNLLLEMTRKENEDSTTEIVNLLRPKMCDEITIYLKPRTSVVHANLLKEMKKVYEKNKKKIKQLVG